MSKWIRSALRPALWPRPRFTLATLALIGLAALLDVATAGGQALSPAAATATSTRTATTASLASVGSAFFPIGPGYADVVPHQLVRADNGRLYVFASQANAPSVIQAYRTKDATLPSSGADFASMSLNTGADIISLAAAYDGGNVIHVLVNTQTGAIRDYPYDVASDTFKPVKSLATGSATALGLGTSGLAAMFSRSGLLHMTYWASGDRIIYQSYRYNATTDTIQSVSGPVTVDGGGRIARHPTLAVSPLDDSVVVAWVSPQSASNQGPGDVFVRTLSSAGAWGTAARVNQAPAWTSTNEGIDIDQGPSVVVGKDGDVHLAYIENYDSSNQYGRIHYVRGSQASWTDSSLSIYTHDASLAIDDSGALSLIGHGYPQDSTCLSMNDLCVAVLGAQGQWGPFQLLAKAPGSDSFDASVSTKWSVVGWNQPGIVEFAFFSANGGSYSNTTLYYGRLAGSTSSPSPTPTATPTATRSTTPTVTPSATPTQAPTALPGSCAGLPNGQWCAEYYANSTLSGAAASKVPEAAPINHNWASGGPGNGIANNNYSARWSGTFAFAASGTYTFTATADDGVRVWVDSVRVIDRWIDQAQTTYKASVPLAAGNHTVKMEYFEHVGLATARLDWTLGCSVGQVMAAYYRGTTPPTNGTLPVVSLCESTPINHDWAVGGPGSGVGIDNYSARWTGLASFASGDYTFIARSDDGVRLWVDGVLLIDQWKDQAPTEYRAIKTMTSGEHAVKVEYDEHTGGALAQVSWQTGSDPCAGVAAGKYCSEYFANTTLSGSPTFIVVTGAPLSRDWKTGGPGSGVPTDSFSARWTGSFAFAASGTYTFTATADDGIRVWVDGSLLIDQWKVQAPSVYTSSRSLSAGTHTVRVEYFEQAGGAVAKLSWAP